MRPAALGLAAAALSASSGSCATTPAATASAGERSVSILAADGSADALLFTPAGAGPWPAVLVFPDVSGLRPTYNEIGRELAAAGYVVLIPNAFYRSVRLDGSAATAAPTLPPQETFARGQGWRALATDQAVMADTRAFLAWLDSRPEVDRSAPIAAIGYDIGAAHAFLAARAAPERIGAVAAIHPSAIATTRENSPHLFVRESRAAYLVQIAAPDDAREPDDKDLLRAALAEAGLTGTVEVVPAEHGFAVPDQPGYDAAAAQDSRRKLLALLAAARQ
jgi:carboxymethylenebutenolidase